MPHRISITDFTPPPVFINSLALLFNVKIGWELAGGLKALNVVAPVGEWISEGWSGWYRLLEGTDARWRDRVYGVDDVNNTGIKVFAHVHRFTKRYCTLIGMWHPLILESRTNIPVYVPAFLYPWEVSSNIVCIGEWARWRLPEIKRPKNWVRLFCCNTTLHSWMIKYLPNRWAICTHRDLAFIFTRHSRLRFTKL